MAGDWIKMRTDLYRDPAVIQISHATGLDRFAVIGRLHGLWAWFDENSTDGRIDGIGSTFIDDEFQAPGLAAAMIDTKWLDADASGLTLPKFFRHNGQTAKVRAAKTKQKRAERSDDNDSPPDCRQDVAEMSPSDGDKMATREEKRREDENREDQKPQLALVPGEISLAAKDIRDEISQLFEAFWAEYPRKVGKPKARAAFERVFRGAIEKRKPPDRARFDAIMAGLRRQRVSRQWTDDEGRYVPHPTTWLNRAGWEDDVGPVRATASQIPPECPYTAEELAAMSKTDRFIALNRHKYERRAG